MAPKKKSARKQHTDKKWTKRKKIKHRGIKKIMNYLSGEDVQFPAGELTGLNKIHIALPKLSNAQVDSIRNLWNTSDVLCETAFDHTFAAELSQRAGTDNMVRNNASLEHGNNANSVTETEVVVNMDTGIEERYEADDAANTSQVFLNQQSGDLSPKTQGANPHQASTGTDDSMKEDTASVTDWRSPQVQEGMDIEPKKVTAELKEPFRNVQDLKFQKGTSSEHAVASAPNNVPPTAEKGAAKRTSESTEVGLGSDVHRKKSPIVEAGAKQQSLANLSSCFQQFLNIQQSEVPTQGRPFDQNPPEASKETMKVDKEDKKSSLYCSPATYMAGVVEKLEKQLILEKLYMRYHGISGPPEKSYLRHDKPTKRKDASTKLEEPKKLEFQRLYREISSFVEQFPQSSIDYSELIRSLSLDSEPKNIGGGSCLSPRWSTTCTVEQLALYVQLYYQLSFTIQHFDLEWFIVGPPFHHAHGPFFHHVPVHRENIRGCELPIKFETPETLCLTIHLLRSDDGAVISLAKLYANFSGLFRFPFWGVGQKMRSLVHNDLPCFIRFHAEMILEDPRPEDPDFYSAASLNIYATAIKEGKVNGEKRMLNEPFSWYGDCVSLKTGENLNPNNTRLMEVLSVTPLS